MPRSMSRAGTGVCLAVSIAASVLAIGHPASAAPPTCDGRAATIVGTHGDDWLQGTGGDDVIVALGGADHVNGRGGDDIICGGGGDDEIHGGRGDDRVFGDGGDDDEHGGGGRDVLSGGPGDDRLNGGFGADRTLGNGGSDRCWGEAARCEHKTRTTHRLPAGEQLVFTWRVDPVTAANQARVASTWRPGCPVGTSDLRLITAGHLTDGGRITTGELVIHQIDAADLVTVLGTLFDGRFPIHRMDVIDVFGGDDLASMRANNTSGFNCRTVAGTSTWSQHASGRAVDVNPLVNPWVRGDVVDPPEGAPYVVRDPSVPGLIVPGDVATRAFAAIGWGWGGDWRTTKDYQHFSATGR